MRCHSQAITIKLTKDVPIGDIEQLIANDNQWVKLIPNTKADSVAQLTPAAVSGLLTVPIGRVRKMRWATVPVGLHLRRPVAVGCRRTVAAHGADPC